MQVLNLLRGRLKERLPSLVGADPNFIFLLYKFRHPPAASRGRWVSETPYIILPVENLLLGLAQVPDIPEKSMFFHSGISPCGKVGERLSV